MKVVLASAGITPRFSMAPGADERYAQRHEPIAQFRRFACREHQPNIGEHQAKRADDLDQFAIGHVGERLKFASARPQAGERNCKLRLPAFPQQVLRMRRYAQRFEAPIG